MLFIFISASILTFNVCADTTSGSKMCLWCSEHFLSLELDAGIWDQLLSEISVLLAILNILPFSKVSKFFLVASFGYGIWIWTSSSWKYLNFRPCGWSASWNKERSDWIKSNFGEFETWGKITHCMVNGNQRCLCNPNILCGVLYHPFVFYRSGFYWLSGTVIMYKVVECVCEHV